MVYKLDHMDEVKKDTEVRSLSRERALNRWLVNWHDYKTVNLYDKCKANYFK